MQTADQSFTMGLRLLMAARRIEELTDDYCRERLAPLAGSYRERANELMAGVAAPASANCVNPI